MIYYIKIRISPKRERQKNKAILMPGQKVHMKKKQPNNKEWSNKGLLETHMPRCLMRLLRLFVKIHKVTAYVDMLWCLET